MFERPHHQRIALVLQSLDSALLRERHCLFAGGTAIALRFGEFRESVDIDFLVSDVPGYRDLRQLLTGTAGIASIGKGSRIPFSQLREIRADQYGIRTTLKVDEQPMKFEIVLEGRIELEPPTEDDELCGVATLTRLDMAASKLLANSDRWADDSVFSRDLIDLAMMRLPLALLRTAADKARGAYGDAIHADLRKALDRMEARAGWLDRCMQGLAMNAPRAMVWQNLRALRRLIPR